MSLLTKVISDWKFFSRLMAQGNSNFSKSLSVYLIIGGVAILIRQLVVYSQENLQWSKLILIGVEEDTAPSPRNKKIFIRVLTALSVSTLFLPAQPWRHLTSTLLFDVVKAVSTVLVAQHLRGEGGVFTGPVVGSNPLGTLRYNPAEDPYYITNLDEPVDEFFASALEGVKFTNIMHIVLESMRSDSYPYDEDGLLAQHIKLNEEPPDEGGTPINTETITPFISSLADNTISWHTMWSTIPYTHKAMLGRTFLVLLI